MVALATAWSVAVIVERYFYYHGRKVNFEAVKSEFTKDLHKGDLDGAAKLLAKHNAAESNVTLAGLRSYDKGLIVLPLACPPLQNGGCPTSDAHARLAH